MLSDKYFSFNSYFFCFFLPLWLINIYLNSKSRGRISFLSFILQNMSFYARNYHLTGTIGIIILLGISWLTTILLDRVIWICLFLRNPRATLRKSIIQLSQILFQNISFQVFSTLLFLLWIYIIIWFTWQSINRRYSLFLKFYLFFCFFMLSTFWRLSLTLKNLFMSLRRAIVVIIILIVCLLVFFIQNQYSVDI